MARLCVVLLHSTDEPALAVGAVRAAHAAVVAGRPCSLFLGNEGARLAARGVAETLSGGPRPDVAGLLREFLGRGGRIHVSATCWEERGFARDALLPEASLEPSDALSRLAAEGCVFVSF